MKTLLKNGKVINVFTGEIESVNVLIQDDKIIGVGDYQDEDADIVENLEGKYLCPGFIDGHIHIESTMLTPVELARVSLIHGTTTIIADPHEIANVCGKDGINYMLEASENLPLHIYFNLPSCVPSTAFDESGATLSAKDLKLFYAHPRVLGLAEMMNYPGVLIGDKSVMEKINDALNLGKSVDGHAPFLSGKDLDKYITAGISTDHECSNIVEAKEKIRKGQWVMVRQGTAARNLKDLIELFDSPYSSRCLLVTDDRHPADLISEGHIDNIIRLAVKGGKSVISAVQMATINAAQCFNLKRVGAIAPSYRADIVILDDLQKVDVYSVYSAGKKVVDNKKIIEIQPPKVSKKLMQRVFKSFNTKPFTKGDFYLQPKSDKCRVIEVLAGQIITKEFIKEINWKNNGIDIENDILKLAVIERHKNTGHKGVGFIKGIGLKNGAIASSVSHDSHNIIVIGTNEADMALAANQIRREGGNVVVVDGKVMAKMSLPIAGLMADKSAEEIAKENEQVRLAVYSLGVPKDIEPFMNMAFVSLTVIPELKMSTTGLVLVEKQQKVDLYVQEK